MKTTKITKKDVEHVNKALHTLFGTRYPFMIKEVVNGRLTFKTTLSNGWEFEISFLMDSEVGTELIAIFPHVINFEPLDFNIRKKYGLSPSGKHNFFYTKEDIYHDSFLSDMIEHIDGIISEFGVK